LTRGLQCPVYFAKKLATFYDENALSQRESLRFWLGYIPNSCLTHGLLLLHTCADFTLRLHFLQLPLCYPAFVWSASNQSLFAHRSVILFFTHRYTRFILVWIIQNWCYIFRHIARFIAFTQWFY